MDNPQTDGDPRAEIPRVHINAPLIWLFVIAAIAVLFFIARGEMAASTAVATPSPTPRDPCDAAYAQYSASSVALTADDYRRALNAATDGLTVNTTCANVAIARVNEALLLSEKAESERILGRADGIADLSRATDLFVACARDIAAVGPTVASQCEQALPPLRARLRTWGYDYVMPIPTPAATPQTPSQNPDGLPTVPPLN